MPRGQADFGMYQVKEVGATLSDMADLAVRLGSIVEYDRRGDVIFLDDYESPTPKYLESASSACSAKLNTRYARSGAQCVKLLTDGTKNRYAGMYYDLSPLVLGKHGAKVAISFPGMFTRDSIYVITALISSGSYRHWLGIRLNPYNKTLEYINESNKWTTFEPALLAQTNLAGEFHNLKLVYDLDNGIYQRFLYDILSWDMSAYAFQKYTSTTVPRYRVNLYLQDLTGYAFSLYQDDYVHTINEP